MEFKSSMALYWVLLALVLSLYVLRLVANAASRRRNRGVLAGDICMTISFMFFIVDVCTLTYTCVLRKENPLSLYTIKVLKLAYVHITFYIVGVFTVKFAFLAMYLSLSEHMTLWSRRIVYGVGIFCGICGVLNLLIQLFWCVPISRNWDITSFCSPPFDLAPAAIHTATNLMSDILILGLGVFIISKLQMSKRQSIAFAFIVCVGFIPLAVTAVRFSQIYTITVTHDINNTNSDIIVAYTLLDWAFAMVAACLPSLRVYLRRSEEISTTRPTKGSTGGYFSATGGNSRIKTFQNSLLSAERGKVTLSSEAGDADDGAELLVFKNTTRTVIYGNAV